jgi:hypothetical protein
MTKIFLAILVLATATQAAAFPMIPVMVAIGSSATEATLDGSRYCRTIQRNGMFGQPSGPAKHCVSFKDGKMTDNANTFFGNPPETKAYRLKGNDVQVKKGSRWKAVYTIEEKTLVNDAHVLLLVE